MRVLVACEYSARVRDAFRARGHDAISCDLEPCEGDPRWHYTGDVHDIAGDDWDLMVAHPPCTYLANSGVRWLYNPDKSKNQDRWRLMRDAADFFDWLHSLPIKKIAIENPIPHRHSGLPPHTQTIQPWQFGHMETKRTCLWLKNLPKLDETNNVYSDMMKLPYADRAKVHYASPGPHRWKERSRTYDGIARAMAEQWGNE